jgi:8-oxo-dGTP pyrophosphatase MutT (NUDIX family)
MHRHILLSLLDRYVPPTSQEQLFKQRMLSFIHQYHTCFERSLTIGHITASCWLLNKAGTHALLTHHAKLDAWFQLGGHCDGNPDVLSVALREAQEESGISSLEPVDTDIFDIDIHTIPANSREAAHEHYDVRFLLRVTSNETESVSSESTALRWISANRADLPTDNPATVRMFNKWIARR